MPFGIRRQGKKYLVVKKSTGKVFGRFNSKASAVKQEQAIYLSMKRRGKV